MFSIKANFLPDNVLAPDDSLTHFLSSSLNIHTQFFSLRLKRQGYETGIEVTYNDKSKTLGSKSQPCPLISV